jgi:hypothetical protein
MEPSAEPKSLHRYQVNKHITRLTEFIEPSEKVNSAILAKNQTILLNREMDEPVASLLSLELKRRPAGGLAPGQTSCILDPTHSALYPKPQAIDLSPVSFPPSELYESASDVAANEQRCRMFTTVYRFLAALASGNKQAQEKLHPLVGVFLDHEGIEGLPVSPTIAEVFRNNPTLLSQVMLANSPPSAPQPSVHLLAHGWPDQNQHHLLFIRSGH